MNIAICIFVLLNIPLGLIGLVLAAGGVVLMLADSVLAPYIQPLLDQLPIPSDYALEVMDYFKPMAIALLIIGTVFLMLALISCIALCCKSDKAATCTKCLLTIYAIVIGIFLLVCIGITVVIGAPQQFAGGYLSSYMNETLVRDYIAVDSTDAINVVWNVAQLGLQCCGVKNGQDYNYAVKFNRTWVTAPDPTNPTQKMKMVIPPSCCTDELLSLSSVVGGSESEAMKNPLAMKPCIYDTSPKFSNYAKGCYDALFKKYYEYQWYVLGPAIGICLILLFLFVVPIVVICKSKKGENETIDKSNKNNNSQLYNDYNNYK